MANKWVHLRPDNINYHEIQEWWKTQFSGATQLTYSNALISVSSSHDDADHESNIRTPAVNLLGQTATGGEINNLHFTKLFQLFLQLELQSGLFAGHGF